jgi:hypothetical protein
MKKTTTAAERVRIVEQLPVNEPKPYPGDAHTHPKTDREALPLDPYASARNPRRQPVSPPNLVGLN